MTKVNGNFKIEGIDYNDMAKVIEYKRFNFSAGEIQIEISDEPCNVSRFEITARLTSSENIIELMMVNDALNHLYRNPNISLRLVYTPYSRQDRVSNEGEAFGVKVFARLINSMNFSTVMTYDNHSDVSTALIDNVIDISQLKIIERMKHMFKEKYAFIISPDAGANKKAVKIAQMFGVPMIQADKIRDTKTGEIAGTEVYSKNDELKDQKVLIVDDICDGGRTVIEIAKVLKQQEVKLVDCFFTHGIFSKGLEVFDDINHLYTTNSFKQEENPKLTVSKLM